MRCSHSTQAGAAVSAAGTFVPASQVSTAAKLRLAAQPDRERELVELDAEARAEIPERAELVQLRMP